MFIKKDISPWRDLASAMFFEPYSKILTWQLTLLLAGGSLVLSYVLPSTKTQSYVSMTEYTLSRSIPQSRISGASR